MGSVVKNKQTNKQTNKRFYAEFISYRYKWCGKCYIHLFLYLFLSLSPLSFILYCLNLLVNLLREGGKEWLKNE